MTSETDTRTAAVAQRLRKALLAWPQVVEVYGPQLGKPEQFFMRVAFNNGESFAIELTKDSA